MNYFRKVEKTVNFNLGNGIQFEHTVAINTVVHSKVTRFGINQEHIDDFIDKLLKVEVEGRKIRTQYRIPMQSGAPQAENFLWTILGNKVKCERPKVCMKNFL